MKKTKEQIQKEFKKYRRDHAFDVFDLRRALTASQEENKQLREAHDLMENLASKIGAAIKEEIIAMFKSGAFNTPELQAYKDYFEVTKVLILNSKKELKKK